MINDPIADMLIRIKNAYLARQDKVVIPPSHLKRELVRLLSRLGYVGNLKILNQTHQFQVELLYKHGQPVLSGVTRISKPGLRRYLKLAQIKKLRQGLGYTILSTPKGLLAHTDAVKAGVGGEILCRVW